MADSLRLIFFKATAAAALKSINANLFSNFSYKFLFHLFASFPISYLFLSLFHVKKKICCTANKTDKTNNTGKGKSCGN
jgi:hypothetical protein